MSFATGYRGVVGGSVQSAYTDQPGVGVPGMVAFASDNMLKDAVVIGEANGIAAGRGVRLTAVSDDISLQRPNLQALLPAAGSNEAAFAGILLFDEAMQSDENGVPGWADGRMGRIAKNNRAGGRIYVKAVEAVTLTDTVNWVTIAPVDASYAIGEFSPSALGGTTFGTSVAISTARWVSEADAGGVAIIELLGA